MTDIKVTSEPLTYEPLSPHSFFRDAARAEAFKDEESMARLARHQVEMRANSTVAGVGGELAPPAYLISDVATAAKVGRHFADILGSRPIPRGVSSINIPRIVGTNILGQDTAIQNNLDPTNVNEDATAQNNSPVVSITGRVDLSQQLYDQAAGAGADVIYYTELQKDYDAVLNGQLVNGTGINGQLTGLANFSYLATNTVDGSGVSGTLAATMIAAHWPLLGQAAANVGNTRGHKPDFWLMAPRRWFAIAGSTDGQGRPIMSPAAQAPGVMPKDDDGPNPVSNIHGIPVYTEGAIPVTASGGSVGALADTVYCGRTGDTYLFESDPMMQTSVNATAGTLTVRCTLHRYAAFVGNLYTSAYGRVTNIPRPTAY